MAKAMMIAALESVFSDAMPTRVADIAFMVSCFIVRSRYAQVYPTRKPSLC